MAWPLPCGHGRIRSAAYWFHAPPFPGRCGTRATAAKVLAWLADAHTSDEEKGAITLVMLGHAGAYLLLAATEVTWVALTAARVLRHRGDGLRTAVRTGVHTPTLAAFVAADLGYVALRRAILARIDRRIGFRPRRP